MVLHHGRIEKTTDNDRRDHSREIGAQGGGQRVSFESGVLLRDKDTIFAGPMEFRYEIMERRDAYAGHVLRWDAMLHRGGWIAGAVAITLQRP
jgi:hypothetical protein